MSLESFEVTSEGREERGDYSTRLVWRAAREFAYICIDKFEYSVPCCQNWGDAMPVVLARSTLLSENGDGCLR